MRFAVLFQGRSVHCGELAEATQFGRQQAPDEPMFQPLPCSAGRRMAIAPLDENSISRQHVLLTPVAEDRVQAINLTAHNAVSLHGGPLAPGESRELFVPCQLSLGALQIRVESEGEDAGDVQSLAEPVAIPGKVLQTLAAPASLAGLGARETERLAEWLRAVVDVLQSAAGSQDFYERAARAVVDLVGLDAGRLLLYEDGDWRIAAEARRAGLAAPAWEWRPSSRILDAVLAQKKTTWRQGFGSAAGQSSLAQVDAVAASPILDRSGEVIGALYGDRQAGAASPRAPRITQADAMLVETLAAGVAAGIARLEQEQAALAAQVRFEQFFTAELARELALHPDLLQGRDAEVSLLFCDIRGFSGIAEQLGPAGTMEWINDVLGDASECVIRRQGVLVDYVGDELLAMWGAPASQPDHAQLACLAAIDIWQTLPELNRRWLPRLKANTEVGIGVNTGPARVGNTGTQRKFKYGPLGNTVNVCSRVQGATRHLKTGILITADTRERLHDSLAVRRLAQVRAVNIAAPVTLYELCPNPGAGWQDAARRYEQAIEEFEQGRLAEAQAALDELLAAHPDDGPAAILRDRASGLLADRLADRIEKFDPVWDLPGK
ncbi:MAG TPA: adenylate/guanylate cyclase domain-containing protein [Pirellulales bacterium]|nr:adenylate/guanylate cyclase domain-containing protein [Pirellulales bacterium]